MFYKNLVQDTSHRLKKLLLGYEPKESFSKLLGQIGTETNPSTRVGSSILDLFPDYTVSKVPVFQKYMLEKDPIYFTDKFKTSAWLRDCDDLLVQLLVLVHTTSGAPPRCPELLSIMIANLPFSPRNLSVKNGKHKPKCLILKRRSCLHDYSLQQKK